MPTEPLTVNEKPEKTLPPFPMIQPKRRRVMYYATLVVSGFEFDALVDTAACLSEIPL